MKKYSIIVPEVIVGIGDKTIFLEQHPPFLNVINLHILLEDWLGDDLMVCHPCYLITENLKIDLEDREFSGFKIDKLLITKDAYFLNNYRQKKDLQNFYWLKIAGVKNTDDLFLDNENNLQASREFISYLKENFSTKYLQINPERNEFDELLDKMIEESGKNIKPFAKE